MKVKKIRKKFTTQVVYLYPLSSKVNRLTNLDVVIIPLE